MSRTRLVAAIAMMAVATPGLAADGAAEAARRCVTVADSLARLVCYDKAFAAGAGERAEPARAAPGRESAPRAANAPAMPSAPPAAAPALGDETLRKTAKERMRDVPQDLSAVVSALKPIRQNTFRITLDNGQVWEQMDMSSRFQIAVGDPVRIERSKMGAYYLEGEGARSAGKVRVTRLK